MEVDRVQGISAREEFRSIRLGDRRLDKRFLRVVEDLFDSPTSSINEAMGGWAEAKAAYRLFDHEELTEEKVLAAHRKALKARVAVEKNILVVQDTTSLTYTSHTGTAGLGSVAFGPRGKNSQGLFMHTAYVLRENGEPQGIMDQVMWSRAEVASIDHEMWNENHCWVKCLRFGRELAEEGARLTYICDREGDFWDLMSAIEREKSVFVIRLVEQRCLKKTLAEWFGESPVLGEFSMEMEIYRKTGESRYHQERKKEEITFCVQIVKMDLKRTSYYQDKSRDKGLEVYLVHAFEKNPPSNREAIKITLKTNEPVQGMEDGRRILRLYRYRWQIESFHKILKSGFRVERTRLAELDRLKRYLSVMSIGAWRLHAMTHRNRRSPHEACTSLLSEPEWKALYCRIHATRVVPETPPSLNQAIRWIAQLGGFLGRKSDGHPGMITLWRGWNKLSELAKLYEALGPPS